MCIRDSQCSHIAVDWRTGYPAQCTRYSPRTPLQVSSSSDFSFGAMWPAPFRYARFERSASFPVRSKLRLPGDREVSGGDRLALEPSRRATCELADDVIELLVEHVAHSALVLPHPHPVLVTAIVEEAVGVDDT